MRLEAEENNMKRMKVKFWIFLIYALVLSGAVHAQTANCSQRLAEEQARFDLGNLPGIPERLEECINSNGFSPEEKIRAHKLITLVYLYLDDQPKAEEWIVKLLRVDKEHQLDPVTDPADIFHLYEKFRSKPIFRVKLYGGLNLGTPSTVTYYGAENTFDERTGSYSSAISLSGGVEIEKEIYKGISIAAGMSVVTRNFTFTNDITGNSADISILQDNVLTLLEDQTWGEIPVSLRYQYLTQSDWVPFVMAGVSPSFLISSSFNGSRQPGGAAAVERSLPDVIGEGLRNRLHLFYFGGLGIKRKVKTNFIVFDARYMKGITNLSSGDRYGANQDLYFRLAHVDDNFSLNNFMFTLGFQLSIYNPEKIKR